MSWNIAETTIKAALVGPVRVTWTADPYNPEEWTDHPLSTLFPTQGIWADTDIDVAEVVCRVMLWFDDYVARHSTISVDTVIVQVGPIEVVVERAPVVHPNKE